MAVTYVTSQKKHLEEKQTRDAEKVRGLLADTSLDLFHPYWWRLRKGEDDGLAGDELS